VVEEPDIVSINDHVKPFLYLNEDSEDIIETNHLLLSSESPGFKLDDEIDLNDSLKSSGQYDDEEVDPGKDLARDKNTIRTSSDDETEQITTSSSQSDVLKIGHLNLIPSDEINQDCMEESDNADSGGSKSESNANNNDGCIAGKDVEFYTSGHLLTGEEVLAYCQWLHRHGRGGHNEEQTVIGLVSSQKYHCTFIISATFENETGLCFHLRLATLMLEKVPQSTQSCKQRKCLSRRHLDGLNIFRCSIYHQSRNKLALSPQIFSLPRQDKFGYIFRLSW
jgi:hypothetical protein